MLNIDKLVMDAYKAKLPEMPVLKEIKSRIQQYKGSKEALTQPYSDAVEIKIINKIKKEHEETRSFLTDAAAVKDEDFVIGYLESLLPKEATAEEIEEYAKTLVKPGDKSGMRFIKDITAHFPGSDGKLIKDIVVKIIGG